MAQAALNTHEKKQKVTYSKRSNGAQLAGLFFLIVVVSVLLTGGWLVVRWMKDEARLPLSKLVVTGERHYTTDDDIRKAILSVGKPGTFMTVDVNIIQQQIERLPWIKQASIRKQWPDVLKIHITEYMPVARWNDLYLLDTEGKSFSIPNERAAKLQLPLLYGPEGTGKDVLQGYERMNAELVAKNFKLKAVAMSVRHSWQLTLDNDVSLKLGRKDDIKRIRLFTQIYPALMRQAAAENKRIDSIDLRYESGGAVEWAPAFIDQTLEEQMQVNVQ